MITETRKYVTTLLLAAAVTLLATGTALAGEGKKCEQPLDVCLAEMAEHLQNKGWVGIEIDRQEDGTLLVTRVFPDSPAERSELRKGDLILALNGVSYATASRDEMAAAYKKKEPGSTITYTVRRGDEELEVPITLAKVPEPVMAKWIAQHLLHEHGQPAQVAEKGPDGP